MIPDAIATLDNPAIVYPAEPSPQVRRLMESLGVRVEVDPSADSITVTTGMIEMSADRAVETRFCTVHSCENEDAGKGGWAVGKCMEHIREIAARRGATQRANTAAARAAVAARANGATPTPSPETGGREEAGEAPLRPREIAARILPRVREVERRAKRYHDSRRFTDQRRAELDYATGELRQVLQELVAATNQLVR